MIKIWGEGECEIQGSVREVLAQSAVLVGAVKKMLIDEGMSAESAEKIVMFHVNLGMKSPKELNDICSALKDVFGALQS